MGRARAWIESHQILTIVIGAAIFAAVAMTAMSNLDPPQAMEDGQDGASTASRTSLSAADAAAQIKDLMEAGEKAELVSSYDFSDTERVIYVTDLWNSKTVAFKKDFLAKVAMLQKTISGHYYFGVRNDHSNEKVGEVTAFSGSLEVYK